MSVSVSLFSGFNISSKSNSTKATPVDFNSNSVGLGLDDVEAFDYFEDDENELEIDTITIQNVFHVNKFLINDGPFREIIFTFYNIIFW